MKPLLRLIVAISIAGSVTHVSALSARAAASVDASGFILVNTVFNTGNPANPDIATVAKPDGESAESFLISPRQSRLALTMRDPESRWSPAGKMEIDFWGLHSRSGAGAIT